jgi:transcriptional regulator with XRE-family HTH domain
MTEREYTHADSFNPPPIGAFVREARMALHLSQAELARRCNLSRAYINTLESGNVKDPSARTLALLARALDIDILDMLGATGTVKVNRGREITDEAQLSLYLRRTRHLSEPSIGNVLHLISLFKLGDRQDNKKAKK